MLVKVVREHPLSPQLILAAGDRRVYLIRHHEVSTKLDWRHILKTENDRIWMLHSKHVYHSIKEQNSNWRQHSALGTHFGFRRTGEGPLNPQVPAQCSTTLGSARHSNDRDIVAARALHSDLRPDFKLRPLRLCAHSALSGVFSVLRGGWRG